ncbi:hypothetical protein GGR56DRAFT_616728 [Xylariaceae sp. FL0804]|nr:hypothetical protein GGR56DRAFT_616728 [Xylariaceae sp. FL0804]
MSPIIHRPSALAFIYNPTKQVLTLFRTTTWCLVMMNTSNSSGAEQTESFLSTRSALGGIAQPTPQGTGPEGFFTATDNAEIITEKIFWSFDLVQCFAFGTAKLSVLFFYRRIFRGKTFHILTTSMIIIVVIWTVGFFFAILFRCGTQFWALWAPLKYLLANCYDSTPLFQAFAISDVITDTFILIIPVYWTTRLHMTFGRKIAVCGVFLLGGVVIGAGIARLVIFIQQTNDPYQNADGIGHLTTEMYWSMIEMGISVVAACLPAIWPLFGRVSLESMVHTVRSMLSLESLTPSGNRGSGERSRDGMDSDGGSQQSGPYKRIHERMGEDVAGDSHIEAIPLGELEAQKRRQRSASGSTGHHVRE